ncbi:MAG: MarR family transcriptional regulator [Chloroflexota bacterium]|nr:MarR family transcriptional regulator [Chloroflexota bacterium]
MTESKLTETDRARLTGEIIRLQRQMRQFTPSAWLDLTLTIGQLKSLFFIDFAGVTNFRKLASALGVTPPNVTGIIDRLVEQGLVSREENPENRRELLLQTTEEGKALVARLRESGVSRTSGILAQLSLEELAALARGLAALARVAQHNKENKPQ